MMKAFYLPEEDSFAPTELTVGPWDPGTQHAGPPSALLGHAIESTAPRDERRVVRITVEVLRPVPVSPLSVTTRVVRAGRSVELIEAVAEADGQPVLRATGARVRTTELELPGGAAGGSDETPPGPESTIDAVADHNDDFGYFRAMQWRFVHGALRTPGPATVWLRMRHPLLPGETPSPLVRVLIAADSGNGVSSTLDWAQWQFISTDLTVYLHRPPAGEWVCLDARSVVQADGTGVAQSALHDETGPIATGLQSLFVAPQPPRKR